MISFSLKMLWAVLVPALVMCSATIAVKIIQQRNEIKHLRQKADEQISQFLYPKDNYDYLHNSDYDGVREVAKHTNNLRAFLNNEIAKANKSIAKLSTSWFRKKTVQELNHKVTAYEAVLEQESKRERKFLSSFDNCKFEKTFYEDYHDFKSEIQKQYVDSSSHHSAIVQNVSQFRKDYKHKISNSYNSDGTLVTQTQIAQYLVKRLLASEKLKDDLEKHIENTKLRITLIEQSGVFMLKKIGGLASACASDQLGLVMAVRTLLEMEEKCIQHLEEYKRQYAAVFVEVTKNIEEATLYTKRVAKNHKESAPVGRQLLDFVKSAARKMETTLAENGLMAVMKFLFHNRINSVPVLSRVLSDEFLFHSFKAALKKQFPHDVQLIHGLVSEMKKQLAQPQENVATTPSTLIN